MFWGEGQGFCSERNGLLCHPLSLGEQWGNVIKLQDQESPEQPRMAYGN